MLIKIFGKYNIKNKINLRGLGYLLKAICFYVMIMVSSIHGMEIERENDGDFNLIKDVIPKILGEFHKVSPIIMAFGQKPSDVNSSVILSLVCKNWREIIVKLRCDNRCKLRISGDKKLVTLEDYKVIRDSGYTVLDVYSKSLEPQDVSYLNCLINITQLVLLPRKIQHDRDFGELALENQDSFLEQRIKPEVIQKIHLLKNLKILSLNGNNIKSDDLKTIVRLENIIKLDLTANNAHDDILLELASLKKLRLLKLILVKSENPGNVLQELRTALPCCVIQGLGSQ